MTQETKSIIIMGVAGSGKTTVGSLLARTLHWEFFDADDFHSESNREKMSRGIPLTDEDRASWLLSLKNMLDQNNQTGRSIILACSALKESYRDILKINKNIQFVYLQGTYKQIEDRLRNRAGHFMSAKMLASQFEILEEPKSTLIVDVTNPPEEIVHIIRKGFNL